MTLPMIGNQALLVHLFMAVAGDHPVRDHAYLRQAWQACGEGELGLDSPIATTGLPVAPTEWDPAKWPSGASNSSGSPGRRRIGRPYRSRFCTKVSGDFRSFTAPPLRVQPGRISVGRGGKSL